MQIPTFKNEKEFQQFIAQTSPEEIRKLSTAEWNQIYDNINRMLKRSPIFLIHQFATLPALAKNLASVVLNQLPGISMSYAENPARQPFVRRNADTFYKLNSNYRPEPQQAKQIKKLAAEAAQELLKRYPEIKEEIISIEFSRDLKPSSNLATRIQQSIYNAAYKDKKTIKKITPNIKINPQLTNTSLQGLYLNNHNIELNRNLEKPSSTIGHEIFHSLQGISQFQKILSQIGINATPHSQELETLYQNNDSFYFQSNYFNQEKRRANKKLHRAYSRQPVEYTAFLFGNSFCREIMKQIGNEKFSSQICHQGCNIFSLLKLSPDKVKLSCDSPRKIEFFFKNLSPSQQKQLSEINQRYIAGIAVQDGRNLSFSIKETSASSQKITNSFQGLKKLYFKYPQNRNMFLCEALPDSHSTFRKKLAEIDLKLKEMEEKLQNRFNPPPPKNPAKKHGATTPIQKNYER